MLWKVSASCCCAVVPGAWTTQQYNLTLNHNITFMFSAKTSTVLQASRHQDRVHVSSGRCGNSGLMHDVDFGSDATVDVRKRKNKRRKQKRCYDKLKWTCVDESVSVAETRLSSVVFVYLPVQDFHCAGSEWAALVGSVKLQSGYTDFEKSHRSLNRHSVELKMGFGWTLALKCKSQLKWERKGEKKVPHNTNWFLQL